MEPKEAFAWLVALVVGIGGILMWMEWPAISGARKCDEAIQRGLLAPSTYRRVDYSSHDNATSFYIEYDAENAMGVPIRRTVSCSIAHGFASVR